MGKVAQGTAAGVWLGLSVSYLWEGFNLTLAALPFILVGGALGAILGGCETVSNRGSKHDN